MKKFILASALLVPAAAEAQMPMRIYPVASKTNTMVLELADSLVGAPYRMGGRTPLKGFDCSGFVQFVFAEAGVALPRTARQMAMLGETIPHSDFDDLQPGDLLFLNVNGRGIDHVAIYADTRTVVHATKGGGVRYDRIDSEEGRWIRRHLVRVRRIPIEVDALKAAQQ